MAKIIMTEYFRVWVKPKSAEESKEFYKLMVDKGFKALSGPGEAPVCEDGPFFPYQVSLKEREILLVASITCCAACLSGGIKMISVEEFKKYFNY